MPMGPANLSSIRSGQSESKSWYRLATPAWVCLRGRPTRSLMHSLPQSPTAPAWDFASADPSLNRMVAACGPPTTLRAVQAFTLPCLSKPKPTNDAFSAVLQPSYQSIIARFFPRRYIPSMATEAKTKLVAIVDDDELMRGALRGLL